MPKIKVSLLETYFVYLGIFLYVLAFIFISLHRYWQFNAFWYDFGILDEAIWKLSRFQLPVIISLNPPIGKIIWADHFNPSSIFLAPLYWFTDKQEIVFVAQAVFVGLSSVIAYLLARQFVKNAIVRISLIVSYLGYTGLQNALYTDIHNIVYSLLPFMIAVWAVYKRKWWFYWIFFIIFLGFQENLANMGFGFGFFLILKNRKEWKIGFLTIIVSLLWAIGSTKMTPIFDPPNQYVYQPHWPASISEWFIKFSYPVIKLKTIFFTYASFGFLPLGAISILPMVLGNFSERFVLNVAGTRWDLGFHYNSVLSPIMFLGSLEMIIFLQKKKWSLKLLKIWAGLTILLVIFLHRFYLHGPLMLATHPYFYKETASTQFLNDFVDKIPKNGLIMAQNNIVAHLIHNKAFLLNEGFDLIKPDVVAIDARPGQNANNFYPLSESQVKTIIGKLTIDPSYKNISDINEQYIFVRK